MKTKEELNALKEEVKALNRKLSELNEDELAQVCGGRAAAIFMGSVELPTFTIDDLSGDKQYEFNVYTPESVDEAKRRFQGE